MVSAGIKTDEDVLKAYNDLKMNKSLRYLILKLNDKQTAVNPFFFKIKIKKESFCKKLFFNR